MLTAYSYIPLTLRYAGPGGTAAFIRIAFGRGLLAASINVLLILSYVAIMSVYAVALASYSLPYLPPGSRAVAGHVIASLAVIVLGLVNFAGAALVERLGLVFNVGKLGVLGLFIVGGFVIGQLDWGRLEPKAWSPASTIVASGMLGFLAYEGFELIANASNDIIDPKRTLPIAFLGSVIVAIIIYMLALSSRSVTCHSMRSLRQGILASRLRPVASSDRSASPLWPPARFSASASAINADYFGAAKLPVMLSLHEELPSVFHRSIHGKSVVSLATIGVLALIAVNALGLHAISAATSGGFLVVYAAVNMAAIKLAPETGGGRIVPGLAAALCVIALAVMIIEFLSDPATVDSGIAVGAIVLIAVLIEAACRAAAGRGSS